MPFMFGPAPIRRTFEYLQAGKLLFRDRVHVMEVHYNQYWKHYTRDPKRTLKPKFDAHVGLREFYFWHIPHIQYKNPDVQIVRFLEMTPNPFIRCWLEDGKDVLFDCYSKTKDDILDQLIKTLGKTQEMLDLEQKLNVGQQSSENPAIFGFDRRRWCMCEIAGQLPCPAVVQLPKNMRQKYTRYLREELEKEEQEMIEGKLEPDFNPPKYYWKWGG